MDCSKIDDYLMKYMDNTLTKEEAKKMNLHLSACEKCKQDFMIYDEIIKEFSETELIEAPEDLEIKVMAQIAALEPVHVKVNKTVDYLMAGIIAFFAVAAGSAIILFINRESILNLLSNSPTFSAYADMLSPVSEFVSNFTQNASMILTTKLSSVITLMDSYKYVILLVSLALFGVQIFLYKKDKDKVEE